MTQPFVGEIRMFSGAWAPRNWAFCDGSLRQITDFQDLYALLGTTYGGDGYTTFGLPDLRGRIPIHVGPGPGLTPRLLGQKGGWESVRLESSQLPAHRHDLVASASDATASVPTGSTLAKSAVYKAQATDTNLSAEAVSSYGSNGYHSNLQPYLCINFIISMEGTFPQRP